MLLATASFDFYVRPLARKLGFDVVVCTRAAWAADGSLTGAIDGDNCYGEAKLKAVLATLPQRPRPTMIVYTDHHSDWQLLLESDHPVAVSPTAALRRLAKARGIEVRNWW